MGNLVVSSQASSASSYNKLEVHRATTRAGVYAIVNGVAGQDIAALHYYDETGLTTSWYKTRFTNTATSESSEFSDPFVGNATKYVSVEQVTSFLQMATLTSTSSPTIQEVVELIQGVEDEIDRETGHAWRTRYCMTDTGKDTAAEYEYHDVNYPYEYQTGRPIYLNHRQIEDFDSAEGDAFQYWNGSTWEDWLADKTEGRASDFWVHYIQGILYVKGYYWAVIKPVATRFKYRYGDTIVPGKVNRLAKYMAVIQLLTGFDTKTMIMQEGAAGVMNHSQRVQEYQGHVDEFISQLSEWRIPQLKL